MRDSNPPHPRCKRGRTTTEAIAGSGLTETPPAVCTRVCTSQAENAHAAALIDPDLAAVFEVWPTLPEVTRRKVLAMGKGSDGKGTQWGPPAPAKS